MKIELNIQIKQNPFIENYNKNGQNKYILKAFLNCVLLNNVTYYNKTNVIKIDITFVLV